MGGLLQEEKARCYGPLSKGFLRADLLLWGMTEVVLTPFLTRPALRRAQALRAA